MPRQKLLQEGSSVFARTVSQEAVADWPNETKTNKEFLYLACLYFLGIGAQSEELGVRSAVQLVEMEDSASKAALDLLSLAFKAARTSKVETLDFATAAVQKVIRGGDLEIALASTGLVRSK